MVSIFPRLGAAGIAACAWLMSTPALAEWQLNMPEGVTPISREVHDLHMLIFWVCVLIGIVVFGVMFYSIYHHRKDKGAVAAQFHESTLLEFVWTLIPLLILVGMAIPATRTLVAMEDHTDASLTIQVTGYQWRWKYDYLDHELSFFSTMSTPWEQINNVVEKGENYLLEVDNHMVVPVNTKLRILTTASDVIHAWWVPDLGWKRDAIPGFVNENWTLIETPGIYRGQCAELCGRGHGFMPIVVEAVPEEQYRAWVANMKAEQMARTATDDTAAVAMR